VPPLKAALHRHRVLIVPRSAKGKSLRSSLPHWPSVQATRGRQGAAHAGLDRTAFFLYARKSTDDLSRQVRSIEDQLAELRQLARRKRLEIIDVFIEHQTAKLPGRPVFNQMLDRVEHGEANGLLAWHPDRLSRNSLDAGRITEAIHQFSIDDTIAAQLIGEFEAERDARANAADEAAKAVHVKMSEIDQKLARLMEPFLAELITRRVPHGESQTRSREA
jgi:hypothetical protein